jgi:heat shock protein HslJ
VKTIKNLYQIFTAVIFVGLMIISANAQTLKGNWKLVEAEINGEEVVFNEEIKTNLSFGEENRMFGNSGCNRYSTVYILEGRKIDFQPIISTKMACGGEAMKQENTFFSVIEKVERYKIKGNYLIFFDKSQQNVLKFARS